MTEFSTLARGVLLRSYGLVSPSVKKESYVLIYEVRDVACVASYDLGPHRSRRDPPLQDVSNGGGGNAVAERLALR